MSELTVIFPTAAALFILLLAGEYIRTRPLAPRREKREVHMQRADHLAAWALAALYAVVAFVNLGDTRAVESWCRPEGGEALYFEIPEGESLAVSNGSPGSKPAVGSFGSLPTARTGKPP